MLTQLFQRDRIELGQSLDRLKQAGTGRYSKLLTTYQTERYLLEAFKGVPYVVMKDGATKEDSLTALVQAVHVEKLKATTAYQQVLAAQGSDAADFWLVEQSLAKARSQTPDLLARLKARGWATDLVNFRDREERYSSEALNSALDSSQPALP